MKRYELTNTRPLAYEPDYRMVEDTDGDYVLYSEAAARIEALESALRDTIGRCEDMLMQDDAQAYKETERMLPALHAVVKGGE